MSTVSNLAKTRCLMAAILGGAVLGGLLVFVKWQPLAESAAGTALAAPTGAESAAPVGRAAKGQARPSVFLTVVTCYPGLTADRVERTITQRVEGWLDGLPGMTSSMSRSIAGVSMVKLTLQQDADAALSLARVNALVLAGLPALPPSCPPPLVQLGEAGDERVLGVLVLRDPNRAEAELWDWATGTLRPLLTRRAGLRAPVVLGGKKRQIGVYLDQTKLQLRALSISKVAQALEKQERLLPLGAVHVGERRLLLDAATAGDTIARLPGLPVGTDDYLRDVGTLKEGSAPQTSLIRIDGRRTVCLPVFRSDTVRTPKGVQDALTHLEKRLPAGVQLSFQPCGDEEGSPRDITMYLRAPSGVGLAATEQRVAKVEHFLQRAIPAAEREWIMSELGVKADPSALYTQNSGPQDATIRIRLTDKPSHSAPEYAARLRELFQAEAAFADLSARFRSGSVVFSALDRVGLADLDVEVTGGTTKQRLEASQLVRDQLRKVAAARDVFCCQRADAPALRIEVDRAKAARLGLSTVEVLRQTAAALAPVPVRGYWIDATGKEFSVTIQFPQVKITTVDDILNIPLKCGVQEQPIPFREVGTLRYGEVAVEIDHVNGFPALDVLVNVEGQGAGAVADEVEKSLRALKLPGEIALQVHRLTRERKR